MTERHTERSMLDLLHQRYNVTYGNGFRWVCAEHVRSDAGFFANRTADFMAVDLWPSSGIAIHGHEVKVSRSDWLAELRQPEKAWQFRDLVDYWWVVVSDPSIVKADELPADWGLLVRGSGGLRAKVNAPRLSPPASSSLQGHRDRPPLPRGFVASLLRSTAKTAGRLAAPADFSEVAQ